MVRSVGVRGRTWNDALADCRSPLNNGDLLSVENKYEMDFINEISSKFGYHKQLLWIGLNDQQNEGIFIWSDGTSYNRSEYTNWGPGEPSNQGGERCVTLLDKVWNNDDCTKEYGYICEKRKGETFT